MRLQILTLFQKESLQKFPPRNRVVLNAPGASYRRELSRPPWLVWGQALLDIYDAAFVELDAIALSRTTVQRTIVVKVIID